MGPMPLYYALHLIKTSKNSGKEALILVFYSSNKYLLNTLWAPRMVLGPGDFSETNK